MDNNEKALNLSTQPAVKQRRSYPIDENILPAPNDPSEWQDWQIFLGEWRKEVLRLLNYQDVQYNQPEFAWTASCYSCCFVMMFDQNFYNPQLGDFTIETFLDRGTEDFGGYDAVVLWHAYPRIGFDDRNQYDFYRDMPGGLEGIHRVIKTLHKWGIKVFIAYYPWDISTRREAQDDFNVLAELVQAVDADGIFLDTIKYASNDLRQKLDAARPGVALEPEVALPIDEIHSHHLSWAQWFSDSLAPGVLRNKWLERRHMMHQIQRFNLDHSGELHTAWMNGSGILVWENVFGTWVGWNARDRSFLRWMLPVQRRYSALFTSGEWTPLVGTQAEGVYASLWEKDGVRLWTLINRLEKPVQGILLKVQHEEGAEYYDLGCGTPAQVEIQDGWAVLSGRLPGRGLGSFLSQEEGIANADFQEFLRNQAWQYTRLTPDTGFPGRSIGLKTAAPTRRVRKNELPKGMAFIEGQDVEMTSFMRNRECGLYDTAPLLGAGSFLARMHETIPITRPVRLYAYAIDQTEVTNRQFLEFLQKSGYTPRFEQNFLNHWANGRPNPGEEDQPVVYVDLDDARAYAAWSGKRLPTEEEWQYALESGIAGYGSQRVWNWTESERTDRRTRFCILKGGSELGIQRNDYYADAGPKDPSFASKFILMWPGLDRSATIGFRCVLDILE